MGVEIATIKIGRFKVYPIQDGLLQIPADTVIQLGKEPLPGLRSSRLLLGLTCLVVKGTDHIVVIDTGLGDKPLGDLTAEYNVQLPRQLISGLETLGIRPQDVDIVILTHLHWDHCAGSTKLTEDGTCVPTFPNATYVVQMLEWEWAAGSVEQAPYSYHQDDFLPLRDASQLQLVKGTEQVIPGIRVELTGGHCPGHQVVWIEDSDQTLLFPADIIPTPAMLQLDQVMSYDLIHSRVLTVKQDLIRRTLDCSATIVFQHAAKNPVGTLERDCDGDIKIIR